MPVQGEPGFNRGTWSTKLDFLMSCVGLSVGLGNIWRFPYLCYKNGGGAFLIPYLVFLFIGGIPLVFLEVAVGQFMSTSGIKTWNICPLFQGIGWTSTIVVSFGVTYYAVIVSWTLHFMFASFTRELPWETCKNAWNTDHCSVNFSQGMIFNQASDMNDSNNYEAFNGNILYSSDNCTVTSYTDPATEYWENRVLAISSGIDEPGTVKWDLCLCLLFTWIIVYFCLFRGIKASGKVVYFTAIAPYVLLFVLMIKGCTLPGAINGIKFYLIPDLSKLRHMQVWVDAATQIFFTCGPGFGCLITLGSFNKWNHNCYRDVFITTAVNFVTSLFAGFVIFSVMGHMAFIQETTVEKVAESGPGLAFIVYPKALSTLPFAPVWSAFFFFTILLIGIDTVFIPVESILTVCIDTFVVLQTRFTRAAFIISAHILLFLMGLFMVTNGGMYVFQIFDYYVVSRILFIVALLEVVIVAWIYGVDRFYDNLEMMLGFRISCYMKICWLYLSPGFCLVLFIMSVVNYTKLTYERPSGTYHFPSWAVGLGWTMGCVPFVTVPVYAVYNIMQCHRAGLSWKAALRSKEPKSPEINMLTGKFEEKEQKIKLHIGREEC